MKGVSFEKLTAPAGKCHKKGCDAEAEYFVICKYFALVFCDEHKTLEWLDLKGVKA